MHKTEEIELKVTINKKDKQRIRKLLLKLGATFEGKSRQKDYLFNSTYFDFAKTDEALRIRDEQTATSRHVFLTYKGSPKFNSDGHKIREEYETEVANFEIMQKILLAIRFKKRIYIEKIRMSYILGNLKIAIDKLRFGTFLEIEGNEKEIEVLRIKLGLQDATPIRKGYAHLQEEWENRK